MNEWPPLPYCGQMSMDKDHKRTAGLQNANDSEPLNGFSFCRLCRTLNKQKAGEKMQIN